MSAPIGTTPKRAVSRRGRPARAALVDAQRVLSARGVKVVRGELTMWVVAAQGDRIRAEEQELVVDTLDIVWRRFHCGAWKMRVVLCWSLMDAILEVSEMAPDEPGFITPAVYLSPWVGRRMPSLVLDCARMERIGVWRDRVLSLVETTAHEAVHAVQHATARADGEMWPPLEARLFGERGNASYDEEGEIEAAAFICALAESTGGNVRHAYCDGGPYAPSEAAITAWAALPLAPLCARMLALRHHLAETPLHRD